MNKLIFFGSDQYSAVALASIIDCKNDIQIEVIADQPKPVGKGLVLTPSPVEILAKTHNLNVSYYPTNSDEMIKFIHALKDLCIRASCIGLCASFDHLIPANIIELFAGNLYNLHPSLLPQYRNVSPVQYAIAMGDTVTGITLFRISPGIDNGEIIAQAQESILDTDTTPTLTPRLFKLGAELFLRSDLVCCKPDQNPTRSDLVGVPLIFTKRLTRDSGYIEWSVLHQLLANQPVPAADTKNELLTLRLTHNPSGTILNDLLHALTPWPGIWSNVPTKKGQIRISLESLSPVMVKLAGKPKPISYADFAKYYL